MKLEALFNAVIVKPIENEEVKYGGIIVPDMGKDLNEKGEVIAVGPGQPTQFGSFLPTVSKVGDIVVLPTQGFTKLVYDGTEYLIGPENQILARVKREIKVNEVLEDTKENLTSEEINDLKYNK
tara:strand:- start:89 stop:460 length:372 start_codon:yes stop_codon:yes gene_type:complete